MGYYDPPEPPIFRCPVSGEMNEDCQGEAYPEQGIEAHDCYDEWESVEPDGPDPDDAHDEWLDRQAEDRWERDFWGD